jgi:competence protein ComEA
VRQRALRRGAHNLDSRLPTPTCVKTRHACEHSTDWVVVRDAAKVMARPATAAQPFTRNIMLKTFIAIAGLTLAFALPAFAATPVNVNTADAETIARSLDGIGLSKAKAIVAYREEHGPFKHVDDLGQVKGVGPATLQRNHDAILLSGEGAKADAGEAAKPRHARKPKAAKEPEED